MTVSLAGGASLVPQAQAAPRAAATAAASSSGDRAKVLRLWQFGGPATKRDAAAALAGTDADITRFLTTQKDVDTSIDLDVKVNQVMANGGPATRNAAQQALDANSDAALDTFLDTGWITPHGTDLDLHVNQVMAAGGPQVRKAAQKALDANAEDALRAFLDSGWQAPFRVDQDLKVNQIMAAGGPEVKKVAQQALDANSVDALNQFLAVDLPVAQARDAETDSIAQLTATAKAASVQAASETDVAKRQSDLAVTEAAAAQKAAQAAKDAAAAAQGHVEQAAAAASRAAYAADQAAATARQAVGAANAASNAAHTAAVAASRAATAASQAGRAASRAYDAAALAIGDRDKAAAAREAAQIAHDASLSAAAARDAAQSARTVSQQAETAGGLAKDAAAQSRIAADAATDAATSSAAAGADARQAKAAAARARVQADRAAAAAAASQAWAHQASQAAGEAATAADAAATDAHNAEVAALDAAAHAGNAANAAEQATQHANAATAAATAAVNASNQATRIAQDARKADDDRIALAGQQADDAAKAALDEYANRALPPRRDVDQASTWSAETSRLIAEAQAAGTGRATVLTDARKVALDLAVTGGPWTQAASTAALAGSDDQVVDFITTGLAAAAGQDDRVVLGDLSEAATDGFKAAAATALAGSDTAVRDFLRSRDYPGRFTDDSLLVNQLMAAARTAGRTVVVQQAQRALDQNTDQALRAFLEAGQYTALSTDEDLKVNQVMSAAKAAGAREVVAAAQAAIDGPPTLRHEFLTVGQFTAARRDQNTATHNAAIDGLLAQAATAAATATHDANDAQAAAARARNAAQDAQNYADQASAAAAQAATYANQARDAANRAAESAQQAQASANTAAAAAKAAAVSADKASASAAWAQQSAYDAAGYASDAAVSANIAYGAAIDAGKSAQQAAALAKEAWQGVADKAKLEKQNAINQRTWDCNNRAAWVAQSLNTDDCIKLFSGTPAEQQRILGHLQQLCRQLNDPGTVELGNCLDPRNLLNAEFMPGPAPYGDSALGQSVTGLVLAGLLALMCPECDLASFLGNAETELGLTGARELSAMMAEALARGDGLFNAAAAEAAAELGKVSEMAIQADLQGAELARIAREYENRFPLCTGNSFAAGTRVLMADGHTEPIEHIAVGDHVANEEPGDPRRQQHLVEAVHVTDDDHDFVDLAVGTPDGPRTIESTAKHLYRNASAGVWSAAADLRPGDLLDTPEAGRATVLAERRHPGAERTYNLTVNAVHTYYVLAGNTPVLVHNTNNPACNSLVRFYGDDGGHIMADLTDGVLTMSIEKGALSPSGSAMFAQVMRSFGPENVRVFSGKWVPAMPSNLDEFNLNLRNGMTYEQAAANTFTGRQCAKYGLTVAKVDQSKLRGEYGHYTNVEPEFSRP
ncbi:polymorphic toxin-type HINT domain-containing protein [Amycolatopsis sp. NPDC049159]|uniref:polymorphic toxin-type HINT domain-containing protein n=1 Tax=Amycolatopsis sp. NPDC049159 TaxID=3157210 RepID=UPI0033F1056C